MVYQMMLVMTEMVQVTHRIGRRRRGGNRGRLIPLVARMMVMRIQ